MTAVTACTPPGMAVQVAGHTLRIAPIMFHPGPGRVDTIAWEHRVDRLNPALVVLHGMQSLHPLPPVVVDNDAHRQVPLAYVSVRSNQRAITDADITPVVDDRIPAVLDDIAKSSLRT